MDNTKKIKIIKAFRNISIITLFIFLNNKNVYAAIGMADIQEGLKRVLQVIFYGFGGVAVIIGLFELLVSFMSQNPEARKTAIYFLLPGAGAIVVGIYLIETMLPKVFS